MALRARPTRRRRPASASISRPRRCRSTATKIAIDPTCSTAGTASRRPARCSRCSRPASSRDGLPSFKDPDASLAADSPIVLLDIDTGERAPFFAEIDQNVADPTRARPDHPAARAAPRRARTTRSRSATRSRPPTAAPLPRPPGFAALRDGNDFDAPAVRRDQEATRRRSSTSSAAAGVDEGRPRARVGLRHRVRRVPALRPHRRCATPRSPRSARPARTSRSRRDRAAEPPTGSYKRYLGTFKSPDFLTDGETDDSILRRDADGLPEMQGMRDAQLRRDHPEVRDDRSRCRARRSCSATACSARRRSTSTTTSSQQLAEQHCFIIIAGDFIGLTSRQLAARAARGQRPQPRHGRSPRSSRSRSSTSSRSRTSSRGPMAQSRPSSSSTASR